MIVYNDNENSLINIIEQIESFEIINFGKVEKILPDNEKFNILSNRLQDIFKSSRLMPAFGVSLHEETQKELVLGDWLKINFSKELIKNGLKFNSLVFKLEKTQGFNLIRLYNGKYEGRCLFLDLEEETDLMEIIK